MRITVLLGFLVALAAAPLMQGTTALPPLIAPASAADAVKFGPPEPLDIVAHGETLHFKVELARTQAQLEYGLMFRTSIAENAGMLFDFGKPDIVRMWMKDTLIGLDMLYMDASGTVVSIEKLVQPGDLTPRGPDRPVLGVLELKAGTADRLGIAVGDKVVHPVFGTRPIAP